MEFEARRVQTPKASKEWGMGRDIPLPADQRVWGSVVSSPSGVRAE